MPLPAIILICVGCALILGGLVYLGLKVGRLVKAARKVGINNMADVQRVVGRVQRLEPRFRRAGEESGGPGREPAEAFRRDRRVELPEGGVGPGDRPPLQPQV